MNRLPENVKTSKYKSVEEYYAVQDNRNASRVSVVPRISQRFEIHKSSVKFIEDHNSFGSRSSRGVRGDVTDFSDESRARMRYVLEDCLDSLSFVIVLTYPKSFSTDGLKVRRDRDVFLHWLKRQFKLRDLPAWYFWLQEFQLRGAPHLHILLSFPFFCNQAWFKIVGSEDPLHLCNGVYNEKIMSKAKMFNYCVAHANKQQQKELPANYVNPGRWWGSSKNFFYKPVEVIDVVHHSDAAAKSFKAPLVELQKNNMSTWADVVEKQGKERPDEWEDRNHGFNAWGVADRIHDLISEGQKNITQVVQAKKIHFSVLPSGLGVQGYPLEKEHEKNNVHC